MPATPSPLKDGRSYEDVTDMFRRHWDIFRKIIEHDYMSHKAAYGKLREIIKSEVDRPFSFADLACGDAYSSSRCLAGTRVSGYTGIDLSKWALGLAAKELGKIRAPFRLIEGDFERFDKYVDSPPDVVWVGLSLHHLVTEEKARFMKKVRASLPEDGLFIIYEPTYVEGEDGTSYYERFTDVLNRNWTGLTREELDTVFDHVKKSDIPELPSEWMRLGRDAGFDKAEEVYTDPTDLYSVFKYSAA